MIRVVSAGRYVTMSADGLLCFLEYHAMLPELRQTFLAAGLLRERS